MIQFPDKMAGKPSKCLCDDCIRQRPERAAELAEFLHMATTTSAGRYWRRQKALGRLRPRGDRRAKG